MTHEIRQIIQNIHDSPYQAVITIAGAGSQALTWILTEPGASKTILEINVPYSTKSLDDYLGEPQNKVVSEKVAIKLANRSLLRAQQIAENQPVIGIGVTATIKTDRPKRGKHRCFVAASTNKSTKVWDLTLLKGIRDRVNEDRIVSYLTIMALAFSCKIEFEPNFDLADTEKIMISNHSHDDIDKILNGTFKHLFINKDGSVCTNKPTNIAVLPGSFNPLHKGHLELAQIASKILGVDLIFEISITNVDKPFLSKTEIIQRIEQFRGIGDVFLTKSSTFLEKANINPGATFVIGSDTATRLFDPKYYDNDKIKMYRAIREIKTLECSFLVAGRTNSNEFISLHDLNIPQEFSSMITSIPEAQFRNDISSTKIRELKI